MISMKEMDEDIRYGSTVRKLLKVVFPGGDRDHQCGSQELGEVVNILQEFAAQEERVRAKREPEEKATQEKYERLRAAQPPTRYKLWCEGFGDTKPTQWTPVPLDTVGYYPGNSTKYVAERLAVAYAERRLVRNHMRIEIRLVTRVGSRTIDYRVVLDNPYKVVKCEILCTNNEYKEENAGTAA